MRLSVLERRAPLRLEIGLVNNMPDAALAATERQFLDLLHGAAQEMAVDVAIDLKLYTLPEIPRTEKGRAHIQHFYSGIDALWASRPDALIVTGAEPLADHLSDEPYWKSLTKLFDWADRNTSSTLLSCLAAHAGVLHFDGIERRRLAQKCSGVFKETPTGHALTRGIGTAPHIPHSRWNALNPDMLTDRGYRILTASAGAGVGLFAKRRNSRFVFCQSHPEYDLDTLAKEYRRDVGRFLRGRRDGYPVLPENYFDAASVARLAAFEARARRYRNEALLADFPRGLAAAGNSWQGTAVTLYRNWIDQLASEKLDRPAYRVAARQAA